MQRKIERLEAQQAQQVQQAQQTPQPPQPTAPSAPAPTSAPSQAGMGATAPSFYVGPIKVTPGGFIELMVVNRDHNESADWASNYNTGIPFPNSHNFYLSEFHLTERQSRLQSLPRGRTTRSGRRKLTSRRTSGAPEAPRTIMKARASRRAYAIISPISPTSPWAATCCSDRRGASSPASGKVSRHARRTSR
jgi:hypothetical protein